MKKRTWVLITSVLLLAACDAAPSESDIEKALSELSGSEPLLETATNFVVSNAYCSRSNREYDCTATADSGDSSYRVQIKMIKYEEGWKANFISEPTALN